MSDKRKRSPFGTTGRFLPLCLALLALADIAGYTVYCCAGGTHTPRTLALGGAVAAVAYLLAAALTFIFFRLFAGPSWLAESEQPIADNMTLEIISRLRTPALITELSNGKIVWYNRAFTDASGSKRALYGQSVDMLCPDMSVTSDDLLAAEADEGLDITAFGRRWGVRGYRLETPGHSYLITMWNDRNELFEVYTRLAAENTIVAYVMLDNLEEVMQYVAEKYRVAAAQIDILLKDWADAAGGILKEYERDRYVFIFAASNLERFVERKFDILDRIRDVRVGESSVSLTVSIGVSGAAGTLADKEQAARAALDMALQRGGDQVVIQSESGTEFYGGRSRGAQKRTKVKSRVVANSLAGHMSLAGNVLIMGHRNADFDSLGACVGLARLAMFCGVRVNIIVNPDDPNLKMCFDRLKSLPEYGPIFLDAAEAQDTLNSETLLVIADVNNPKQFEAPEIAASAFTSVIIDHHRKSAAEGGTKPAITYIEPSSSSTCELVVEILEQGIPAGQLRPEEADIMFAGLLLDTKQFSRNTGTRTFSAALFLRNEGANPVEAQKLFVSPLGDLRREAGFISGAEIYRGGFAVACDDTEGDGGVRIAAAKAADKLLTVAGVRAAFTLCRVGDTIHVSARSQGEVNVQLILERLGGGGHYDSAATQIAAMSIADAKTMLTDAIDAYLDEEGKRKA